MSINGTLLVPEILQTFQAEETQKQQQALEIAQKHQNERMEHYATLAETQIKLLVPESAEKWIRNLLTLKNSSQIVDIFDESLTQVTEKHRSTVEPALWQDFITKVTQQCTPSCKVPLEQINTAVLAFIQAIQQIFDQHGCFPVTANVDEHCTREMQNILATVDANTFASPGVKLACEQLTQLYKEQNDRVFQAEKKYAEIIMQEVEHAYKTEMRGFIKPDGCSTDVLRAIHNALINKCLLAFDRAFRFTNTVHQSVRDEAKNSLEPKLETEYQTFLNQNKANLDNFLAGANARLGTLKQKYTSPTNGHFDILEKSTSELNDFLKVEVKSMILADDELEGDWKILQDSVNTYWRDQEQSTVPDTVTLAASQMEDTLTKSCETWIRGNLNTTSIFGNGFKKCYKRALKMELEKHRQAVHPSLWTRFCSEVNAKCRDPCVSHLMQVKQAVTKFHDIMCKEFVLNGYLLEEKILHEIVQDKFSKVKKDSVSAPLVDKILALSRDKLVSIYKSQQHGFCIMFSSNTNRNRIMRKIKAFYHRRMTRHINDQPVCTKDKLQREHSSLVEKCAEMLTATLRKYKVDSLVVLEQAQSMFKELDGWFSNYENMNSTKLRQTKLKISKSIKKLEKHYKSSLAKYLNQNPTVDEKILQDKHEEVAKGMLQWCEEIVSRNVAEDRIYLAHQLTSLQSTINTEWALVKANNASSRNAMLQKIDDSEKEKDWTDQAPETKNEDDEPTNFLVPVTDATNTNAEVPEISPIPTEAEEKVAEP